MVQKLDALPQGHSICWSCRRVRHIYFVCIHTKIGNVRFKLVVDHPTPAHFTSFGQYLSENVRVTSLLLGENVRVTSLLLGENVKVTSLLLGEGTSLPQGGDG